ncbi:MAG TPA: molecular chaperone TorD family protein [Burkholderiaceae bacterium]|nr:molecular chaperone TorD family protein [Burkholderiaceae bacterium]
MTEHSNSLVSSALDVEIARAEIYGLLSAFYYASPAADLLAQVRVAATDTPEAGAFLEEPWRAFVGVARSMSDKSVQNEYDDLFGGIGKPEVYLYGSHFLNGFLNEKSLARLRTDLQSLGLERSDAMADTEDHIAYLFEVMRYLVAGDDVAVANLTQQREFFSKHIQPWVNSMCNDIKMNKKAVFYAALSDLTVAFMGIEAQGFDMLA